MSDLIKNVWTVLVVMLAGIGLQAMLQLAGILGVVGASY